jgi:6-phosphogluconolactonase
MTTRTKVVPGTLVAAPDAVHVAREASSRLARLLREAVAQRGRASLALSGGSTPRGAYEALAGEANVPWSDIDVFWVDERAVPPTDARSNYRLANEALLAPANVPGARVHRMRGEAADLEGAAAEYESTLREHVSGRGADGTPALDVLVMGVGEDGHTASLFPGSAHLDERTRLVVAVPAEREREARLTFTVPVIEHARAVLVLATGASKAEPLERIWATEGALRDTPARLLRNVHGALYWLIDHAAAGLTR